jgi:hypothetical protein
MTKVLERIREVKPSKMYFISDGPRNEEEREKVDNCRKAAESIIDWDCEVIKNYSDTNMGCRYRVYSGITFALEREEKVIIIEDDILPSISFFRFMDEMLERYSDNEEIMMVSGNNRLDTLYQAEYDYMFTKYPSIWGWGTWKNAWKKIDIEMSGWNDERKKFKIKPWSLCYEQKKQYDLVGLYGFDTWDYQWRYARQKYNGIGVATTKNLIKNIGFGEDATHTKKQPYLCDLKANEIDFPLKEPDGICVNSEYDKLYIYHFYTKGICVRIVKDCVKKILKELGIYKRKI